MKKLIKIFIAAVAMLVIASPLYAAGDKTKSSDMTKQDGMTQGKTATELEGMEVVSKSGEKIGKIEKVSLNEQTGDIKFVTITKGGILGIGGETVAIPLEALSFEQDNATLLVDQSKLETAPKQAKLSDNEYQSNLQSHYGVSPGWQQDSNKTDMNKSNAVDQDQVDMDAAPEMNKDLKENKAN